ncbi:thermonuclease family protein [Hyphomicrobium sp.]|uniref:thermonuclease family protein n=1 Tax=Hyphomicrobium sp. TaxID=82 RepID=UPI002C1F6F53|nr:thermonuclease family protein [Hyphomicrobium sp.]HVZ04779.1 thermonuclease family protein [Hyphomicrobium sp.]
MRVVIGVASVFAFAFSAGAAETHVTPCTLNPGPIHTVTRVLDGETLVLDDGSAVRLMGALAPRARDANAERGVWPPEIDAIKALSDLVLGKRVKLAFGGRQRDRYGRFLAQVFLEYRGTEQWVQGTLLTAGHARMYGLPGSFACARELLAHEAEARRARLGLWSNGVYRVMPANHPGALMKLRGKYERVMGSVATIGKTKSTTYLNFGADWHSDFTVRIGKKVLAANPDFARIVDGLTAKRIIVRGWIERRNGPLIDVVDPSQIEVQGDDGNPNVSAIAPLRGPQPASAPGRLEDSDPKELRPASPESGKPGAVNL